MLTLICPGLMGPIPVPRADLPRVPAIDRLIARGERKSCPVSDVSTSLLGAFGIEAEDTRDPPVGALCLLGEGTDAAEEGYWFRADPVFLRPDRDRLLVYAPPLISLDQEEADSLVALFNGHFAPDGLMLIAPRAERWYLRSEWVPDLRTRALEQVLGRPIPLDWPRGSDARRWGRLMNEVQMLFHGSEVNRRREQQRRPPISGIWTWGGGGMPPRRPADPGGRPDLVCGDDVLSVGLARWAGVAHQPLRDGILPARNPGDRTLVAWTGLQRALDRTDAQAWCDALVDLDAQLASAQRRLGRGELAGLTVDTCAGVNYRLTRGRLRRFWQRGRWIDHLAARGMDAACIGDGSTGHPSFRAEE
jgi:hypothetical protein